jgi:CubicO group peptidase (beta-lactamase class C family)
VRTALALALFLLTLGWQSGGASADDEASFASIDQRAEQALSNDDVVGLAYAIVKDGRIVHERGLGVTAKGGTPVTPATPFQLGSMSKAFTAVAVLALVEQKRLDLDAPAQRYLPWFELDDAITLRHLANHTSGIPRDSDPAGGDVTTLDARVRHIARTHLEAKVGERHSYASANYQVLGRIVEEASGSSFGAFVHQRIFSPLHMSHGFVDWNAAQSSSPALGHRYWFGFPRVANLPHESDRLPTASLLGSAHDLALFELALLGKDPALLSPASFMELFRPTVRIDETSSYAMGWRVGTIAGERAIHHGGILPHYRGKMVMLVDRGFGVVVLTNTASLFGTPTSHRLADDIAKLLVGQSPSRTFLSLHRLHLFADVIAALIVLNVLQELVRLRRFREALPTQRKKTKRSAIITLVVGALLLSTPWLLGIGWRESFRVVPDFSLVLFVTQLVACAIALTKLHWLRQRSEA